MNTRKIIALNKKVEKQAQKAIDKIYKTYSLEMNSLISKEILKGQTLKNINGISFIEDSEGNIVNRGKAWGFNLGDQLDKIALLQYSDKLYGSFNISFEIKGTKPI